MQFKKNRLGFSALLLFSLLCLIGLYAPLLASSKPLLVLYRHKLYFPLFRYLFYPGFFTKPLDLFYNLLMFTLPAVTFCLFFCKKNLRKGAAVVFATLQLGLFFLFTSGLIKDPESYSKLAQEKQEYLRKNQPFSPDYLLGPFALQADWDFDLRYMSPYAKLNLLLRYQQRSRQHAKLTRYEEPYQQARGQPMPTLWAVDRQNYLQEKERLEKSILTLQEQYTNELQALPTLIAAYRPFSHDFIMTRHELEKAQALFVNEESKENREKLESSRAHFDVLVKKASSTRLPLEKAKQIIQTYRDTAGSLNYLTSREAWLEEESHHLRILISPFLRPFHWEDDAGGKQSINQYIPWWELTRVNRKDLVAGLLFGIRISLVVGITAVALSLLIGIPLGLISGFFAGKVDIAICRLIEIWEAMPTFFMLLLVIAIAQCKSIFLVIAVLGFFGWTGFARFLRAEVLKQRNLPYVLACRSLGFRNPRIMISHILPNAIPPILTLLPFSMMAAITSEAALSFLGLGEEGSTSWGILMDEGRSVFPGESYLLWPPAILLTLLLVCIALVGDALRDALDPKLR